MTSEGLGEMFEGDSAETLNGKFPLVLMGGKGGKFPLHYERKRGVFSKVVLGFQNFGYDF